MAARWIIPILVLPGTVLVVIPSAILWFTRGGSVAEIFAPPGPAALSVATMFAVPGFVFALWSMASFFRFGEGTAAPWDPPQKLVVHGPYRHVRNPMLSGVIALLCAESLFFQSWPLAAWAGVFFLGNAIYFPLREEPGLRKRFGEDYARYCEHVPRWIPRIRGWEG